jgi:hypothetical protein
MQQSKIQSGSFIRNSGGFTFQVALSETSATLYPIDDQESTSPKTMNRSIFDALVRNKNFDVVNNPNNVHERILTKQYASRFLTK